MLTTSTKKMPLSLDSERRSFGTSVARESFERSMARGSQQKLVRERLTAKRYKAVDRYTSQKA